MNGPVKQRSRNAPEDAEESHGLRAPAMPSGIGGAVRALASAEHAGKQPNQGGIMSRAQWIVVGLLVLSVIINYIDRSDLSIAAPVMQNHFWLSPVQLGSLLAAFFWTYSVMQVTGIAGWLSDRYPPGLVMLGGYLLWSVATMATGITTGFATLFTMRLLLGIGESVAYPCYSRIFAEMPQQYRGRANAFIDAGTKLGPALGAFVGGLLLIHFGWRMLFVLLGAAGMLWMLPWWKAMPRSAPAVADAPAARAPSIPRILRMSCAWGTFLGHFCSNYFFYFLLAWLPDFLVQEEHLSLRAMSRFTSAVFLLIATSTLLTGWISDRLIAAGLSPSVVRRSVVVGGLSVGSALLALLFVPKNLPVSMGLLGIACIGYGAYASNHWAITQTLAGPAAAGRWTSLQNGIANFSGIAAPWIAGWIVERNGSSRIAFVVAGGVALAGALFWGILVPRVEPVAWDLPGCATEIP